MFFSAKAFRQLKLEILCASFILKTYIFFSLSVKKNTNGPIRRASSQGLYYYSLLKLTVVLSRQWSSQQNKHGSNLKLIKKKKKSVVKGPMVTMIRHNTHSPLHSALSGCLLTSLFAEGCKIAWEGVSKLLTGSVYIHRCDRSAVYCP